MFVVSALLLSIIYFIYQRWKNRDLLKLEKQLNSGLLKLPFIGQSYVFLGGGEGRMNGWKTLGRDALRNSNGLTSFRHGNTLYAVVADPQAAEVILKTCLEKDDHITHYFKPYFENGSLFAPVSIWKPRRKVAMPSFGNHNLKHFMSVFVKQSGNLMKKLAPLADGRTISIFDYFSAYAMDAIADSALGYEMNVLENPHHPFLEAFDRGVAVAARRVCEPWLQYDFVYNRLPLCKQVLKDRDFLWGFIQKIIDSKREEIKNRKSENGIQSSDEGRIKTFLELLITSSGGDDGYTDVELIEEALVFITGGNGTTAVATSFFAKVMARYPEVQDKIYNELKEVFGDSDRIATTDDFRQLKYFDAVLKESMRLYPPGPIIVRRVEKDLKLPCGTTFVPDTRVMINIWAVHHNTKYWGADAEEFRPERFFTPLAYPAAYMPFSVGPRNCIGYQFGMTSMKTMLSSFLRHYRVLPSSSTSQFRLKYDMLLGDADNFAVQLEPRSKF